MKLVLLGPAGDFFRRLRPWPARSLAWVSGSASAFSFAPFGVFPLLLAAIAVLVLLVDACRDEPRFVRNAALLGWFWGFGQFLVGLYWVGYAFMVDPANHGWQLPFAVLGLTGGLALFPAAAAAVAALFWRNRARILLFAAAFALAEWLRGHVLTGFPWNLAAYGWGASLAVLQSAAFIGAYGLTLTTFVLAASFSELFARTPRVWPPLAATLAFVLLWTAGDVRLAMGPTINVPHAALRIVQPNVPQAEKYKRSLVVRNWDRLLSLSTRPATLPINVLVWPEAAPPFLLQREPLAISEIADLTKHGTVLITGSVRYAPGPPVRFYNALVIFGPEARALGVYDKFHLVPFGEYVPFASFFSRLGIVKLTAGQEGFSSGIGPRAFAIPGLPSTGPLICYEILFPGAVVGEKRPGWFVNVTDDSWFGPSTGPYQHLLTARVRAIEEGIPVVRAANTGISAVIDALGRTKATLPLDEMGVLDVPLPMAIAPTFYSRFGDLGFWLMLVACGLAGVAFRRK